MALTQWFKVILTSDTANSVPWPTDDSLPTCRLELYMWAHASAFTHLCSSIVPALIYSTPRCRIVADILYPVYSLASWGRHPLPSSGFTPPLRKAFGGGYAYLLWRFLRLLLCHANRFFQLTSSASKWYSHAMFSLVCLEAMPNKEWTFLIWWETVFLALSMSSCLSSLLLLVCGSRGTGNTGSDHILKMKWLWPKELNRIHGLKTCCSIPTL